MDIRSIAISKPRIEKEKPRLDMDKQRLPRLNHRFTLLFHHYMQQLFIILGTELKYFHFIHLMLALARVLLLIC
jgi:hypothetical protein